MGLVSRVAAEDALDAALDEMTGEHLRQERGCGADGQGDVRPAGGHGLGRCVCVYRPGDGGEHDGGGCGRRDRRVHRQAGGGLAGSVASGRADRGGPDAAPGAIRPMEAQPSDNSRRIVGISLRT